MIPSIRIEFIKLVNRRRSYLSFASYLALLLLIYLGMSYSKKPYLAREAGRVGLNLADFMDGGFFAFLALSPTLLLLYPIFISLMAGDLIAGESQDGTLRPILSRPVTRANILFAKMVVLGLYFLVLCGFFAVMSFAAGILFFGKPGDLLFPEVFYGLGNRLRILSYDEALTAIFLSYAYGALGGLTVGALGLLLSVHCNNSASAVIATLVIYFIFHILGSIPPLADIRPFLFTSHMEAWQYFFADPVPIGRVTRSITMVLAFTITFLVLAWLSFERKDIHS